MYEITDSQIIAYGDQNPNTTEKTRLFHEKFFVLSPITQGTNSQIKKQFREFNHVKQMKNKLPVY